MSRRRRPRRRQGPRRRARRPQGPRRSVGSRSRRAQLQFSVSRMEHLLRESPYMKRLSPSTPIFLAGILEYLTAKVLDLASKEARSDHKTRITPEHVQRALGSHQHLSCLLEGHSSSRSIRCPPAKKGRGLS
ncbi:histone H2A-beta, sperm-like, partial [Suricata suricatta]|uniref:histone H2A-beta, sperm-like n=1 Tax=Suricata suricatta TaxID=37032 RepID=UPI0011552B69